MQSGCALNLWARGKSNALEVAKALGYKEDDEKAIYERLCNENAKNIVRAQLRIKDVSKKFSFHLNILCILHELFE